MLFVDAVVFTENYFTFTDCFYRSFWPSKWLFNFHLFTSNPSSLFDTFDLFILSKWPINQNLLSSCVLDRSQNSTVYQTKINMLRRHFTFTIPVTKMHYAKLKMKSNYIFPRSHLGYNLISRSFFIALTVSQYLQFQWSLLTT